MKRKLWSNKKQLKKNNPLRSNKNRPKSIKKNYNTQNNQLSTLNNNTNNPYNAHNPETPAQPPKDPIEENFTLSPVNIIINNRTRI